MTRIAVIAAVIALNACAANLSQVDLGMTEQQVRERIGKPSKIRSYSCSLRGATCYRTYYYGMSKVRFENGRVTGY
jgi:hypothetical protein